MPNQKTLVSTLQLKNIGHQVVKIFVKPLAGSPLFQQNGGTIELQAGVSIEVEDSRLDKAQIQSLANKKLIFTTPYQRQIVLVIPPGSGSHA